MKKQIKDIWVQALRSGEFEQVRGYLERKGKYCALGVLSAIAMVDGYCTYNIGDKGEGRFDEKKYGLSYGVMEWAGIAQDHDDDDNPLFISDSKAGLVKFTHKGRELSIAQLNDNGASFEEIADLIEKYWQDL